MCACVDEHLSYTRVSLDDIVFRHVSVPGGTRRVEQIRVNEGGDLGLALQDLDGETFCEMPCNVAVYRPDLVYIIVSQILFHHWACRKEKTHSRVVGLEGNDDESVSGELDHVSSGRVDHVQAHGRGVICSSALTQNPKVVTICFFKPR